MKLTKKDKMMLLVLGIIMFVAVFFMYGIKPAKDKSAALDADVTASQQELDKLKSEIGDLKSQMKDYDFDKILDDHYDNMKPGAMPALLDRIGVEMYMYEVFKKYHVEGYSTTGWAIVPYEYSNVSAFDSNIIADNKYYIAKITIAFKMEKKKDFAKFIDYLRDDPNFRLINYNIREEIKPEPEPTPEPEPGAPEPPAPDPTEPPAEPEKFYELSGSMNIDFYMGDKYESTLESLYQNLDLKQDIHLKEGTVDTIVFKGLNKEEFEKIEYRPYVWYTTETGTRAKLLLNDKAYEIKEVGSDIEMTFTKFVKPTEVSIMTIGGKASEKRFYKTKFNEDTPAISVISYFSANQLKDVAVMDGEYDTVTFDAIASKYADIVYNVYEVKVGALAKKVFTPIDKAKYTINVAGGKVTVKFKDIAPNTQVAFEARFRDKTFDEANEGVEKPEGYVEPVITYYKTELDNDTTIVSVTTIKAGANVEGLANKGAEHRDTIAFKNVENAVMHTYYKKTVTAEGVTKYEKLGVEKYDELAGATERIVKFKNLGKESVIVVEVTTKDANGQYYRTVFDDATPTVTINGYIEYIDVLNPAVGTAPNSIRISLDTAKYSDIIYEFTEVKTDAEGNKTYEVLGVAESTKVADTTKKFVDITFTNLEAGEREIIVRVLEAKDTNGQYYKTTAATSTLDSVKITIV